MSKSSVRELRPFISVLIIIAALFTLAFLQMETRRLGYVVLKQSRQLKTLQDEYRMKSMRYARNTRSERLREVAVSSLTLTDAKRGQIIHMSGSNIALRP